MKIRKIFSMILVILISIGLVGCFSGGTNGVDGKDGLPGINGENGITPHIGSNGNWFIGDIDTGIDAQGPAGKDGVDGKDGAPGKDGKDGAPGKDGQDGKDGLDGKDGAPGKDGSGVSIDQAKSPAGELLYLNDIIDYETDEYAPLVIEKNSQGKVIWKIAAVHTTGDHHHFYTELGTGSSDSVSIIPESNVDNMDKEIEMYKIALSAFEDRIEEMLDFEIDIQIDFIEIDMNDFYSNYEYIDKDKELYARRKDNPGYEVHVNTVNTNELPLYIETVHPGFDRNYDYKMILIGYGYLTGGDGSFVTNNPVPVSGGGLALGEYLFTGVDISKEDYFDDSIFLNIKRLVIDREITEFMLNLYHEFGHLLENHNKQFLWQIGYKDFGSKVNNEGILHILTVILKNEINDSIGYGNTDLLVNDNDTTMMALYIMLNHNVRVIDMIYEEELFGLAPVFKYYPYRYIKQEVFKVQYGR